ncbi:MAG: phage holin family protein [Gemmatimonadota bacterium]
MRLLVRWLVNAVALYVTESIVPGIHVGDFETLLVAALVIGLVNAIVRPVATFISFPLTVLTLGLFYLVLNGAMFALAARLTPGFELENFTAAVLGAIVMSVVGMLLHAVVKKRD